LQNEIGQAKEFQNDFIDLTQLLQIILKGKQSKINFQKLKEQYQKLSVSEDDF